MSYVFNRYSNEKYDTLSHGDGVYIFDSSGNKYLDMTAANCAVLGYSNQELIQSLNDNVKKIQTTFNHDCWTTPEKEELAEILCNMSPTGLSKVYFPGCNGTDAVECALKMSIQVHQAEGNNKKLFIVRDWEYHGIDSAAHSLSAGPDLILFNSLMISSVYKIDPYFPYKDMKKLIGKDLSDYVEQSAKQLEDKILELGAENVAGFVAEEMSGTSLGDLPADDPYWKLITDICKKHNVHLIIDEIYTGCGRSGTYYCHEQDDGLKPDFVLLGKGLGAGFVPISAVLTTDKIYDSIQKNFDMVFYSHTHINWFLSYGVALTAQKIITEELLDRVAYLGNYIHNTLHINLKQEKEVVEVRGRGLLITIEFNNRNFRKKVEDRLLNDYKIRIKSRPRRIAISPAYIIDNDTVDYFLEKFIHVCKTT